MPPTDEEIRVAIEALRSDAREWLAWSDTLAQVAAVIPDLGLTANEMCAMSELVGLPGLYAAVQWRAAELAVRGAESFASVSGALTAAADGYERDERAAVHRLRGVW